MPDIISTVDIIVRGGRAEGSLKYRCADARSAAESSPLSRRYFSIGHATH